MKTGTSIKSIAFSLLLCCSCVGPQLPGVATIQYVRDILSDSDSPQMRIISSAGEAGRYGGIYVLGTEPSCNIVGSAILNLDSHDNASGAHITDSLPDFAGENVWVVSDSSAVSFFDVLNSDGSERLRRMAVDMVVSALDTSLSLSRYDKAGMGYRSPAKFIILSDAVFAPCGASDIDTLLHAAACRVPVIVPTGNAFRKIGSRYPATRTLGVIADGKNIPLGIYSALYSSYCRKNGIADGQCVTYSCNGSESALKIFLDKYLLSGYDRPLDLILVDDLSVDADSLRKEYETLSSVMNEESEVYGKLFAPDFRIVSTLEELMSECYSLFRMDNLFSHDIKWPQAEYCYSFFDGDDSIRIFR